MTCCGYPLAIGTKIPIDPLFTVTFQGAISEGNSNGYFGLTPCPSLSSGLVTYSPSSLPIKMTSVITTLALSGPSLTNVGITIMTPLGAVASAGGNFSSTPTSVSMGSVPTFTVITPFGILFNLSGEVEPGCYQVTVTYHQA